MDLLNSLLAVVKEFKDFVSKPLTLLAFGILAILVLISPKFILVWLGLSHLPEQHRGKVAVAMILFFVFALLQFLYTSVFPKREQKRQQEKEKKQQEEKDKIQREKDKESFGRKLNTLSVYEIFILAYCLSRDRIVFFVRHQGVAEFEHAVNTLAAKRYFRTHPENMDGYPHYIPDECWESLQLFKDRILEMAKALIPEYEKDFEFLDQYQERFGFGQINNIAPQKETQPVKQDYTLYTSDVILDVLWKWHYKPELGKRPLNLTPYCLDCELELVPNRLHGSGISVSDSGRYLKRVTCPTHRKAYELPVNARGDYTLVLSVIEENIKNEKWKSKIASS